jgi:hypothetical protein
MKMPLGENNAEKSKFKKNRHKVMHLQTLAFSLFYHAADYIHSSFMIY